MKTVAVICEYNPFHNGHKYHIEKIREEFGSDTAIIAIMSGNFTQRGECAILDKGVRAACAVDEGVNLVFELPFPFSVSSAEIFAGSAVRIAESLKVVDYLSFGSESGNIDELVHTAEVMLNDDFEPTLNALIKDKSLKDVGYPTIYEMALRTVCPTDNIPKLTPNNILAIEYIKALKREGSQILPHTVARTGADFSAENLEDTEFQSATAIRNSIMKGDNSALEFVPYLSKMRILNSIKDGLCPCDSDRLSAAVISSFRINSPSAYGDIHDVGGGLYNRLLSSSLEANNISNLVGLAETKKFTKARIRRAMWYCFFGVTSSEIKQFPLFTQLLALDSIGRQKLKEIRKRSTFPILTKPSDFSSLGEDAQVQKRLSDKADSVFQLTKPDPQHGAFALKFTPYVKK